MKMKNRELWWNDGDSGNPKWSTAKEPFPSAIWPNANIMRSVSRLNPGLHGGKAVTDRLNHSSAPWLTLRFLEFAHIQFLLHSKLSSLSGPTDK